MNDVVEQLQTTAMSAETIEKVRDFEALLKACPNQVDFHTDHLLHGGVYSRTIFIPEGTVFTGAHIIKPTILIIHGHLIFRTDDGPKEIEGYRIEPASAGRKMAAFAVKDTLMTAVLATNAKTIDEVDNEVTDEPDNMASRRDDAKNSVWITGE